MVMLLKSTAKVYGQFIYGFCFRNKMKTINKEVNFDVMSACRILVFENVSEIGLNFILNGQNMTRSSYKTGRQ